MGLGTSMPLAQTEPVAAPMMSGNGDATWGILLAVFVTAFLFAIFCGGLFVEWLARRQRRQLARNRTWIAPKRLPVLPFWAAPGWRWMAIRTQDTEAVQKALHIVNPVYCSWHQGLLASRERKLFIAPPTGNWVVVVGEALPDPGKDVDECYVFLTALSRRLGRVVFFHLNKLNFHHAWAWVENGEVIRAYAWNGQAVWNQGRLTAAELELGVRCFDYGEEPEDEVSGRVQAAMNLEKVPRLAAMWSIDIMGPQLAAFHERNGIVGEPPQFHSA
jgi:hypothetical protein